MTSLLMDSPTKCGEPGEGAGKSVFEPNPCSLLQNRLGDCLRIVLWSDGEYRLQCVSVAKAMRNWVGDYNDLTVTAWPISRKTEC